MRSRCPSEVSVRREQLGDFVRVACGGQDQICFLSQTMEKRLHSDTVGFSVFGIWKSVNGSISNHPFLLHLIGFAPITPPQYTTCSIIVPVLVKKLSKLFMSVGVTT